ncbi:hypothetical protein [Candidatus Odyssella acanthamoebae]|uniref:Uncharacterized protein n=1 Tax=Candidatus Odyssella acanthamoebae TaxID=91604 RepID=A0A077B1B6_9PROT|nr:hypothetical protein [Candidatus Paracaedibacter acanthamoebae]AIK96735.1 hypothetical protein ID47_08385 [Candidatus Paracaedibacter acanthamoebae]
MKLKKTLIFLGLLIGAGSLYHGNHFFGAAGTYARYEVYNNLSDLYFPSKPPLQPTLSRFQQLKRFFYKEVTWYKIKNDSNLSEILFNNFKETYTLNADQVLSI